MSETKTGTVPKKRIYLPLRGKILLLLVANTLVLSLFTLLGLRYLTSTYNERLYESVYSNLSQTSRTLNQRLRAIEALSDSVIAAPSIQTSLSTIADSENAMDWSDSTKNVYSYLSSFQNTSLKAGISGIAIYNARGFASNTNYSLYSRTPEELLEAVMQKADEKEGAPAWTIDFDRQVLILSRQIREIENLSLTHLGYLILYVDIDRVMNDVFTSNAEYGTRGYLIFEGENLIYSSSETGSLDLSVIRNNHDSDYWIVSDEGGTFFVVQSPLARYGWTMLSAVSYDTIMSSVNAAQQVLLVLFSAVLIVTLLATVLILRRTFRDYQLLVRRMQDFASAEEVHYVPSPVDYSDIDDELGTLHRQFDTMSRQIESLIQDNYLNQILSKDAQIRALESQINPHFLYNTLETINWRAKALGDTKIPAMTESLGALLRSTLSNEDSLVPLSRELQLVDAYMTIQQIRFEDRLTFEKSCDPTLNSCLIPPLSVQPLLENAIRYGMEEMIDICPITLSCRKAGDLLRIEVTNEGSSFPENLLEKLRDGTISPGGNGIGLLNIDSRIHLLFGDAYGLSFENRGDIAAAVITIPCTTA